MPTRAIAVEQTHNQGGGGVIPFETLHGLRAVADERGLALHCDGARIWHSDRTRITLSASASDPSSASGARSDSHSAFTVRTADR